MYRNPQAESLNDTIKEESKIVYELFSEKGKNIFFPKKGILSQTEQAKGKKINATIGSAIENDGTLMCLDSIGSVVNLTRGSFVSYAPGFGNPEIRKKWQEMLYKKNPSLKGKSFSVPMTTAALTHGLSMLGYLFIDDGNTLCLSDLYWENYDLLFRNAYGAVFDTFSLFNGERFNIDSFREKILSGPKGVRKVILNFPNNPSGYTPSSAEAMQIVSAIKESAEAGNKILAILDDAYFNLVYEEGIERESLFAYLCDIHENVLAVKVDGPTKEDYVWGFRIGFVTYGIKNGSRKLYDALEQKTGGAIRGNISNAPNISQLLLLNAYNSPEYDHEKELKYNTLKERYILVKKTLAQKNQYAECFTALPFNSGYFMCVKLAGGIDGEAVRSVLLNDFNTGIINLNNLLRIAFAAVPTDLIPELFENIYLACKKVAGS
ncbi:MAG: aminotransferase class I/II-fold pyridoxal phosphate-dependent enzyme [Spirochaetia bacterium]|jgi:aspartate/methionine/tyrosine aminotransferase|nr:aminotransferase class I/II-fold pyridoxal phosphate-dependent enzyme [Spirochaetia bacterium]